MMSCSTRRGCPDDAYDRTARAVSELFKRTPSPDDPGMLEETALKAQQESLGYDHYLLEVAAQECEA
jgi:hypothetical protein